MSEQLLFNLGDTTPQERVVHYSTRLAADPRDSRTAEQIVHDLFQNNGYPQPEKTNSKERVGWFREVEKRSGQWD